MRVGKEMPNRFHILTLKNGNAILGKFVMKAREIRIRLKMM